MISPDRSFWEQALASHNAGIESTTCSPGISVWSSSMMRLYGRIACSIALRETRGRSEEHTSELQSLMRNSYAVFCLQKKKHNTHDNEPPSPIHIREQAEKTNAGTSTDALTNNSIHISLLPRANKLIQRVKLIPTNTHITDSTSHKSTLTSYHT